MTYPDAQPFTDLFNDPEVIKFIATTDKDGVPSLEENNSIHLDEEGRIVILEPNEYSQTNRNLVHSIWFNKKVTIHVRASAERQFQVVGTPYKALITGARFESHYKKLRAQDAELAAVWLIDAETYTDENPVARHARTNQGRLPLIHLDRIARAD